MNEHIHAVTTALCEYIDTNKAFFPYVIDTECMGEQIQYDSEFDDLRDIWKISIHSTLVIEISDRNGDIEITVFSDKSCTNDTHLFRMWIDIGKKLYAFGNDTTKMTNQESSWWGNFLNRFLFDNESNIDAIMGHEHELPFAYPVTIYVWDTQAYEIGSLVQITFNVSTHFEKKYGIKSGIRYNGMVVGFNEAKTELELIICKHKELGTLKLVAKDVIDKIKITRVG